MTSPGAGSALAPPAVRTAARIPAVRLAPRGLPRRLPAPAGWAALSALLAYVSFGWSRRWVSDDGFITLHVVSQIDHGNGPVFNTGERIEASTSVLWTWLLAGVHAALPFDLPTEAVILGIGLGAAGTALGVLAAARFAGRPRRIVPAGVLVWVLLPPVWDFASGGLEGGLEVAWLGSLAWTVSRLVPAVPDRRRLLRACLVVSLGPLVRPDFAVVSAVVGLAVLATSRRPGRSRRGFVADVATAVAVMLALPVVVEIARAMYYAVLEPNTALAKEAGRSNWPQGWRYLVDFIGPHDLLVPLVVLAVLLGLAGRAVQLRARVLGGSLPVAGLLSALYVVRLGGDFMHARMLLPALFLLCVPVFVVDADVLVAPAPGLRARVPLLLVAVVAVWGGFCATVLAPVSHEIPSSGIADERAFYVFAAHSQHPVSLASWAGGSWNSDLPSPDPRIALVVTGEASPRDTPTYVARAADSPDATTVYFSGNIGELSMLLGDDVKVIDQHGLSDPLAARLLLVHRGRPGHEKNLGLAWAIAEGTPAGTPLPLADVRSAAVASARQALACGSLARVERDVHGRLTLGRLWRNLLDASANTSLRVPGDPAVAARELCAPH